MRLKRIVGYHHEVEVDFPRARMKPSPGLRVLRQYGTDKLTGSGASPQKKSLSYRRARSSDVELGFGGRQPSLIPR